VRAKAVAALLLSVAMVSDAPAQSPAPRPVFGAGLDLVYVTVTVQDPHGRIVPDLPASAFEVREDGKARDVEVFSRGADERVALDVALLLDTSGSMDAELLTRDGSGRGALILLSDGVDFGSPVTETQLFRAIESTNVAIYPIPFTASSFGSVPDADLRRGPAARLGPIPTAPDTLVARGFLTRMAETSGGRVLIPTGHLDATLDSLVEELSSQYVIGFTPAAGPRGRAHRLDVRVADKRLKVRYRERYLAR
jgi:hypothetical protein